MKAIVVSLKFNPGHVSHMIASFKQLNELGYDTYFYINEKFVDFLPNDLLKYVKIYGKNNLDEVNLAIFLFPALYNIIEIIKIRLTNKCKILYVYHEPILNFKEFIDAGFTGFKFVMLYLKNFVNSIIVKMADIILLPSKKALYNYDNNKLYSNLNRYYVPLMYDDEVDNKSQCNNKSYFSYIGTIASDHSFDKYVNFIKWAIETNWYPEINFLIATRSECFLDFSSPRLTIVSGKPLTNQEINEWYAKSLVIWNAYKRTTQSGVLPKAFMFSTPAIILSENRNEFTIPGNNVEEIKDNTSIEQISEALLKIYNNLHYYKSNARNSFLQNFHYRQYNIVLNQIIQSYKQ